MSFLKNLYLRAMALLCEIRNEIILARNPDARIDMPSHVPPKNDKDQLGRDGENLAAESLKRQGYRILARNIKMPSCELDIVAWDPSGRFLVFIEVKTRSSTQYQNPREAVDDRRIKRMRRAAVEFRTENNIRNGQNRFDIIAIVWPRKEKPEIEHIMNAF